MNRWQIGVWLLRVLVTLLACAIGLSWIFSYYNGIGGW